MRFNPPPNWPVPPAGWRPEPGWRPDPAWGPAPHGWKLWLPERRWWSSGWLLWPSLVVFAPIGIALLWAGRRTMRTGPKIAITVAACAWLITLAALDDSESTDQQASVPRPAATRTSAAPVASPSRSVPPRASASATATRPSAAPAAPVLTGFGATLRDWSRTHQVTPNYAYPCCWGPRVPTGDGDERVPAWATVIFSGNEGDPNGRVTSLTHNFAPGTGEAAVRAALERDDFPPDVRLTEQRRPGGCLFLWYRSEALDSALRGSTSGSVEMQVAVLSDDEGRPYQARQANEAIVTIVPARDRSGTC